MSMCLSAVVIQALPPGDASTPVRLAMCVSERLTLGGRMEDHRSINKIFSVQKKHN